MTLEQIQYFVTSAEAGSFSSAAKQLFVSHSTVSRSVAALERELEVVLLVRDRRSLRCTPAGAVFLQQGRELLHQALRLRDSVARYRTRQQLRIVSIGAYLPKVYEIIRLFQADYPDVELCMEHADQNNVAKRLLSGEADFGISFSYAFPERGDLDTLVVEHGRFCALLSPNHRLSKREYLTWEELTEYSGLLGENPFHGEEPRPGTQPRDIQSIILQIKAGNGITVLPEHAAAEYGQGCIQIPIYGAVKDYQLLLGWRRSNTSGPLLAAIAFFRKYIENM